MRSKSLLHVSRLFVVLAVVAMFCFGSSAGASTGVAKPNTGGVFTFLLNAEPPGMDPIQLREVPQISPTLAATGIFDELVYIDPVSLKVTPKIASSLTTADKGLTWVLKLRSGVRFADGTPYDAAAVQYNWQRIADPANKVVFAQPAQEVATYEIPDPLTLKITLKAANPLWDKFVARNLSTVGSPTALKANAAAFQNKPVGAGPFLLKDWVRGVTMSLVRNPDYWQKGKPYVDAIEMKFINDDTARLNTLTTGGAQAGLDSAYSNIAQYQASGKYDVVNTPANGGGQAFTMNITKPPFNDIRVRQAMSLVLNSKEVVDRSAYGDSTTYIKTIDEKFSPFYNPKLKVAETDPAAAQKLIDQVVAEQGGKPIEFTYLALNVPYHVRIADAIQAIITTKLKNVNVKIDVQNSVTAVPRQAAGDFQATPQSPRWTDPALDDVTFFLSTSPGNYMRYNNPTVDAAIKTMQTTTDPKAVKQAHETVIQNVLKDLPVVFFSRFRSYYAVEKAALKNWKMFYELRILVEDVWLTKPKS